MATFTKTILSGSTNGKGIFINQTSSGSAVTVHTASTTTTTLDEVWIYAHNYDTATRKLTIEWGDTSSSNHIEILVNSESGLVLVVPGFILQGAGSPNTPVVKAFASTSTSLTIHGYVNRITV